MARNMRRIVQPDWVKAKPSAVPRNGAVHGVARTVAKSPWKNDPASCWPLVEESKPRVTPCGSEISKTPNKLSANTRTMTLKARTKYGFVNWKPPQVISRPAAFSAIKSSARPMNQAKMPAAKAIPLRKIFCRLWPACWMNPKILSEMTGSTHGIRFKMIPPRKPKKRKVNIPREEAELEEDAIVGAGVCQAARSGPSRR